MDLSTIPDIAPASRVIHQHTFTSPDGDVLLTLGLELLHVQLHGLALVHITQAFQLGDMAAQLLTLRDMLNDDEVLELLRDVIDREARRYAERD